MSFQIEKSAQNNLRRYSVYRYWNSFGCPSGKITGKKTFQVQQNYTCFFPEVGIY